MYKRPEMTDAEIARIKEEVARFNTPEWQYSFGFRCGNIASFLGERNDAKLNDPNVSESWKQGYIDAWNIHKARIAKLL